MIKGWRTRGGKLFWYPFSVFRVLSQRRTKTKTSGLVVLCCDWMGVGFELLRRHFYGRQMAGKLLSINNSRSFFLFVFWFCRDSTLYQLRQLICITDGAGDYTRLRCLRAFMSLWIFSVIQNLLCLLRFSTKRMRDHTLKVFSKNKERQTTGVIFIVFEVCDCGLSKAFLFFFFTQEWYEVNTMFEVFELFVIVFLCHLWNFI